MILELSDGLFYFFPGDNRNMKDPDRKRAYLDTENTPCWILRKFKIIRYLETISE